MVCSPSLAYNCITLYHLWGTFTVVPINNNVILIDMAFLSVSLNRNDKEISSLFTEMLIRFVDMQKR